MVIKMEIKNVIKRGKTFYFRMRVPKDCIRKAGKREVGQSLKTDDPLVARREAAKLEKIWADRFAELRRPLPVLTKKSALQPEQSLPEYQQQLLDRMAKKLPAVLDAENQEQLQHRLVFYEGAIETIRRHNPCPVALDFPEIGVAWSSKTTESPGRDRLRRKALCVVLKRMVEAVKEEMSMLVEPEVTIPKDPKRIVNSVAGEQHEPDTPEGALIEDAAELMLASKKRVPRTETTLRADVRILQEWTGKKDLREYTKRDMVDFITNCLPYIPFNMNKKKEFKGVSLRECIERVKANPEACKPISYITCRNRLINISMVFNYARDQLGIIRISPASGVEVPKVRVVENRPRGFSPAELTAMWQALQSVCSEGKPSQYWTVVLSLYHGFRLNEVCSLFVKDVYDDPDGIPVIDINENHETKSVKNKTSVRVIPIHPFVLNGLGFREYVEARRQEDSEGLLFPDVSYMQYKGYMWKASYWFARWKKEWLPPEAQYKHFHDLRYTFIQTAQNAAKMPDRHAQEITGHSIEGVSAVHLAYSGRLKPVDLLPELEKVRYGWE